MDKTLDSIQLTHRILMALLLALVLLSLSAQRPNRDYDDLQQELSTLQEAITEAREFREARNKEIFAGSSLKSTISEWFKSKSIPEDFAYEIIEPDHLTVPDSDVNPVVTVADQVLWADKLFDLTETKFYSCEIDKRDLLSEFDKSPLANDTQEVRNVIIDMKKTWDNFVVQKTKLCVMIVNRNVSDGKLSGVEEIRLAVPGRLISVEGVEGSKKNHTSLHHILKDHGLGDFEATHEIVVPTIRANWSDIGQKTPPSALSYIKRIEDESREKRKTRIELLGQSVDAALPLNAGAVMLLALLTYMYLTVVHVRNISKDKEQQIREFPLFGLMWTRSGLAFIICTVFVLPVTVSYFSLMHVAPSNEDNYLSIAARGVLIVAIGIAGALVLKIIRELVLVIDERRS